MRFSPSVGAPFTAPLPPTGAVVGDRYTLGQMLARTGVSATYRAFDEEAGEAVTVHLLHTGLASARLTAALWDDAVLALKLDHPGIVRLLNAYRDASWDLFVEERAAGDDLAAVRVARPERRLHAAEIVRFGLACLEALGHAHGAGIIHGDLKPQNLLLTPTGELRVLGFGLARLADGGVPSGPDERVIGFRSPEQLAAGAIDAADPRTDIYSLGATLFALGNGALLPASGWPRGTRPPGHLPPIAQEVVCAAAAEDPRDRFQSAAEMARALEAIRPHLGAVPPPPER